MESRFIFSRKFASLCLSALIVWSFSIFASAAFGMTTVTHLEAKDTRNGLIKDILTLAISKSDEASNIRMNTIDEALTEARMMEYVKAGNLSVMWSGTQMRYEEEMLPIRVPILKGMLGHRIFIIREGDQAKFNNINTLADLKRIPLGQGRFWGDTLVLKDAQMNVVDPVKYESLFHMLEGERFDFFPRALHEPWNEVQRWEDLNLAIENNILLVYPFALYFFVAPDNQYLANVIEQGFRRAIADGSYNKLFYSNEVIKDALERSNLKARKVFRLPNPHMHPDTPVDEKELWLELTEL